MANISIVRHVSECYIKPKYELQDSKSRIYLAPGDIIWLSCHYSQLGLLFSKPSPSVNNHDSITSLLDNLKHSLSLTLTHFYPLAGQFETEVDKDQHTSSIFINCNKGPGAKFTYATLDMKTRDILPPQDVPHVVKSLFDHDRAVNYDGHTRPLLSIQVTELIDGVFIGCSMNHCCADGASYWNFFNTFSEIFMANGEDIVISKPPIHTKWFVDGAGPVTKLPFTQPDEFIVRFDEPNIKKRIFRFSEESIGKLKAIANEDYGANNNDNSIKISSFQALSAFIWRCITRARRLPNDAQTSCMLAVSDRTRLNPPLSSNYFGNAINSVLVKTEVGELLSQNLRWAASLLHQVVADHTDDKVRDAVKSWTESSFFVHFGSDFDPNGVAIGSSPRFNVYGNEFGMGKALAVLTGYGNKFDGEINSFPCREGGNSIELQICLTPDAMSALETDDELLQAL